MLVVAAVVVAVAAQGVTVLYSQGNFSLPNE